MQLKQFAFYQKKSVYLRQFLLSSEEWENNWKKGEGENTDLELDLQKKRKMFPRFAFDSK